MATVVKDFHKPQRSPYWIACYTDSTGRRRKKSTKLTNKKKALEVALTLEHGEHLARCGAFSEHRLRELLEQTLARVIGGPVRHDTAQTWFDDWVEQKRKSRPASAKRYCQIARLFVLSLGARARLPMEHITAKDVLQFRDSELERGVSKKSANQAITIVGMAFNDALRQQKVKFNPCLSLDALDGESAEREPFTSDEIKQLLDAAEGDWKGAILFAFYTGARLSDIANMTWLAVDFDKHLISFTPKKTRKKKLFIPLHPDLEAELLKHRGVGLAPLFPSLAGRTPGGVHGLSLEFTAIMEKARVHGEIIRHTPTGRRIRTKSFHSLRHTFNSRLANAGIPRELRQILTGHASERMNEQYTHRELEPLRSAIAALPKVWSSST